MLILARVGIITDLKIECKKLILPYPCTEVIKLPQVEMLCNVEILFHKLFILKFSSSGNRARGIRVTSSAPKAWQSGRVVGVLSTRGHAERHMGELIATTNPANSAYLVPFPPAITYTSEALFWGVDKDGSLESLEGTVLPVGDARVTRFSFSRRCHSESPVKPVTFRSFAVTVKPLGHLFHMMHSRV